MDPQTPGRPSAVAASASLPALRGVTLSVDGGPGDTVALPPLQGIEVETGAGLGPGGAALCGWTGCAPGLELRFDGGGVRRVTAMVNVILHPDTPE